MNGTAHTLQEGLGMERNRYQLAGWLAIAGAVLFPLGFIIGIAERIITMSAFGDVRMAFGPGDLVMIAFTVISVYVLLSFKRLLNERYNCTEFNTLIMVSIWWAILFQIIGFLEGLVAMRSWHYAEIGLAIMYMSTLALAMIVIGIVDILIAVKIIKLKDKLNDLIVAFGYITLVAGILEITVIFSVFSLILIPVTCVMLGVIFLREKEEVEFV